MYYQGHIYDVSEQNKGKEKRKAISPHEAIVSRWKAVFLLRGYNQMKEK